MKALSGIRIIDLTMGWAGPLACRHLADMGADVIKVESCERFDWWRSWEATPEWIRDDGAEKSNAFNTMNRNKRDVTLDLEHPDGRELLLQLIASAHAVVENYSGGVLPKLGLGYEVLREVKPDIILLSMPAFGSTGPWAGFRAYGSTVEQSSGLPHLQGDQTMPPVMQQVAYGDAIGGLNGSAALLTALRHQAKTGEGQFVDLSQAEAMFPLGIQGILHTSVTGNNPERQGNFHPNAVPHNVYPCLGDDQWLLIQIFEESQWLSLCHIVGDELVGFGSKAERLEQVVALNEVIANWTRPQEAEVLMLKLQQAGIPAVMCLSSKRLVENPHLKERGFWQWLDRAVVGHQPNPSAPYLVDGERVSIDAPAPTLGQQNREVLKDLLGLDDDRLAYLASAGVVGDKPRMPGTGSVK